eukprot:TRINITY_DN1593_c1_g1_i5.p1 TRINITY_DN1593_c1_g1~~TRINITY_DN1593_c1_g1_i5.p1  ORF type:complete len:702 (+),score=163.22 TRINITY_DN1593_c1_g1_i5:137-2107(+)
MEFKDSNPFLAYAASLGRLRLDPLSEYAGLCSKQADMLSLNLHPLQDRVSTRQLVRGLRRALIELSSHVGLNINLMATLKHLSGPLQFAPGLGPRKAKQVLQMISKKGILTERQDLLEYNIMGECVYRNFAGFVRIQSVIDLQGIAIPPLDDSRVHPDHYFLVDRILGTLNEKTINGDPERSAAISIMREKEDWGELDELDLDKYAQIMEERKEGRFADILQDIKNELRYPFRDKLRKPIFPPEPPQLFSLLTGEVVGLSIRIGQLVTVRVVGISSAGVRVRLDSDISGFIPIRELTDERSDRDEDVLEFIRRFADVGRSIKARITDFVFENLEVRLTAKQSEIRDVRRWERNADDPYIREVREVDDDDWKLGRDRGYARHQASQPEPAVPQRKRFLPRPIVHMNFQNISREEAEEFLARHREDFVVRPSSKGVNFLTVTWKVADDLFAHIEVEEQQKTHMLEEIGAVLFVNKQKFESLDEIIATYLRPMIVNAQRVVGFRKFRGGRQLDDMLRAEKEGNPASIPYLVGFDYSHPGFLTLAYMPSHDIVKESVRITPEGYTYRKQGFNSISELIDFFKNNALSSANRGGGQMRSNRGFSSHGPPPLPPSHRHSYGGYGSLPPPPPPPPVSSSSSRYGGYGHSGGGGHHGGSRYSNY